MKTLDYAEWGEEMKKWNGKTPPSIKKTITVGKNEAGNLPPSSGKDRQGKSPGILKGGNFIRLREGIASPQKSNLQRRRIFSVKGTSSFFN